MSNKRGPGRPRGSYKRDGYVAKKMSNTEVEAFITECMNKIFNEHLSYSEYIDKVFLSEHKKPHLIDIMSDGV